MAFLAFFCLLWLKNVNSLVCVSSRSSCHFLVVVEHHVPEPNREAVHAAKGTIPSHSFVASGFNCSPSSTISRGTQVGRRNVSTQGVGV